MCRVTLFLIVCMLSTACLSDSTSLDTLTSKDTLSLRVQQRKRIKSDSTLKETSIVSTGKKIIREVVSDSAWTEIDIHKVTVDKYLLLLDKKIPISEKFEQFRLIIIISIILFILLNIFIFTYYTLESQTSFLEGHPILSFVISIFSGPTPKEDAATLKDLRLSVFDFMNQHKIVHTLRDSVRSMWSWLIVGEDYRLKNVKVEYAIAATWLLRFGITALVICVAYFLILPVEGLQAPVRISVTVAMSVILLTIGLFNINRKFHILATGFIGGGVAALYLSTFASGTIYHVLTPLMTYLLVAAITSITSYLAIRVNSMLIALIGIVGAYISPIVLELQVSNLPLLNIYLIIITSGVLWISLFKHWKLLSYVAFFFSWAIATGALYNFQGETHFALTMVTFTALFVLHSGIVYYYAILKRERTTIIDVIHLLLNCLFFTLFGTYIVKISLGGAWQGSVTLFAALFFASQLYLFVLKKVEDKQLYLTLLGLVGFFFAYTIPLLTESNTLTVSWALLSFFFLWIGIKSRSNAIVTVANGFMVLFYSRLLVIDVFLRYMIGINETTGLSAMAGDLIQIIINLAVIFGISALYRKNLNQFPNLTISKENDTPYPISFAIASDVAYWIGVGTTFIVGYIWAVGVIPESILQESILTSLWTILGIFVLHRQQKTAQNFILNIALGILIIALCKFIIIDLTTWRNEFENTPMTYIGHFISVLSIELFLLYFMKCTKNLKDIYSEFYTFLGMIFHLMIFLFLTFEGAAICKLNVPQFESGITSVLWGLFAVIYLNIGIKSDSKQWRYLGLLLFAGTVLKMLIFDLPEQSTLYRLISVMAMGIFLISGAFIYISSMESVKEKSIDEEETEKEFEKMVEKSDALISEGTEKE